MPQSSFFSPMIFLFYVIDLSDRGICNVATVWLLATASIRFWTGMWPTRYWIDIDWLPDSTQLVSFGRFSICSAINVKWTGVSLMKNLFRCWDCFYFLSPFLKTCKNFGALAHSKKFLSCIPVNLLYGLMEYCFHARFATPYYCVVMLDKLWKQPCRTVEPTLATFLTLLARRCIVASPGVFYRHYFGRCLSKLF